MGTVPPAINQPASKPTLAYQRTCSLTLIGASNRFLNVQALSGGGGPFTDNQGQLPAGTCVEWRYVTLNGQWVLGKWRGADDNHGSWAFMERTSFPATLPTGGAACP
jgi:hypothetical protein